MSTDELSETYSVGRVAKLTGLPPDTLRAWQRRYGAVEPLRSTGGTRRYRVSDIERLRLLKSAIDAGHRIGDVSRLPNDELRRLTDMRSEPAENPLEEALEALSRLDGIAAEQRIASQISALGPIRFAKEFALPLLGELGERWQANQIRIASEHLGSALLRSLLGSALRPTTAHRDAPIVVFGTLPGEQHEIGLLIAALSALGAGANPLFLGTDLPAAELAGAARNSRARAIALSAVASAPSVLESELLNLRELTPNTIEIWLGGPLAGEIDPIKGVLTFGSLEDLEQHVQLLVI